MHWLIVVGQLGAMTAAATHSGGFVRQNSCAGIGSQLAAAAANSGEAAAAGIELVVGDRVAVTHM